ncbi:hypothetical protein VT98_12362 [Candidatus Electrothrix communis]|uniref:Uncharacterized protein n=1 Tax=Candidatus Electrothrix communis TaxID=1859133 RepID=A0A444J1Z6_9BACT|nr:hypothetical protein VT98_12362 [Candidatus Electrothrix communis]
MLLTRRHLSSGVSRSAAVARYPFTSRGKKVSPKENILWIIHFFSKGITAGAEAVADIMEQEAGSHCIQINKTDHPLCIYGKKKIGNLGISMDNLLAYTLLLASVSKRKASCRWRSIKTRQSSASGLRGAERTRSYCAR